ncbi:hypothetical protein TrLO_g13713 [Triparma laevis f. longispina]|uniref:RING-type domain-containing protein n=1 Tax=Triparma laevis f. longispina TaxID=1714387 RepID=A0A9W7A8W0_9STRA|nr:hypothetical protein TrLO_g13713 [Triparma laevis f. longispina]
MKYSQSPSKSAALAKFPPNCAFPGCRKPAHQLCGRCLETHFYSAKHQMEHWRWHKKICVAPQKKISASAPPAPSVPLKGSVEVDDDTCIICLDNVVSAKLRPCGHSTTCKECTRVLITRSETCPLCRKAFIICWKITRRRWSITREL